MFRIIIVSLFFLGCCNSAPHPRDNSIWPRSAVLKKDRFYLYWKHDDSTITFRAFVKTTSWFGFGLSPNGGMKGADIMVAWHLQAVGVTVIQDMFSEKQLPLKDKKEDWTLIDGSEQDGWTKVTFKRKLDTCDEQDFPIRGAETQRLIWAISPTAEEKVGVLVYHLSANRGTYSTHLLHRQPDNQPLPSDAFSFDIAMKNFVVPHKKDTLWWCYTVPIPNSLKDETSYVINIEPVIQQNNLDLVHHIVVYACYGEEMRNSSFHHESFECYDFQNRTKKQNTILRKCIEGIFIWAVGGRNFSLPHNVAIPLGKNGAKISMFRLEVHYDNPPLTKGKCI